MNSSLSAVTFFNVTGKVVLTVAASNLRVPLTSILSIVAPLLTTDEPSANVNVPSAVTLAPNVKSPIPWKLPDRVQLPLAASVSKSQAAAVPQL